MTSTQIRQLQLETAITQAVLRSYHYSDFALVTQLAAMVCKALDGKTWPELVAELGVESLTVTSGDSR